MRRIIVGRRGRRAAMLAVAGALLATPAGALAAKPTAVVAMGDSAISGESARNYEPGTDQPGDYCHRSRDALIHETAIPGIQATLNLACSGATTSNLRDPGTSQNGEPSQSAKLRQAAATHDIKLIVVEVGANDDPHFSGVASDCVTRFILSQAGCRTSVGPVWPARLAAMAPKVGRVLDDVRAVMAQADPAATPQLVLASYWSPVAASMRYSSYLSKLVNGCPFYAADTVWAHDDAVPALNATLKQVAAGHQWRFLDFSRSMDGREVCATGTSHSREWTSGLTYDPWSSSWFSFDAVRQSFHANARGHAQLGRCVREFQQAPQLAQARCVRGADGNLHAVV